MEIATCRSADIEQHDGDYFLRVLGKAGGIRLVPVPPPLAGDILSSPGEYLFPGRIDGHVSAAYVVKLVSRALPAGMTSEQLRQAFLTSATGRRVQSWRDGGPYHSPDESALLEHPALADSKALHQHLRRIARDIDRDPAAAISECKNLLEGLFKQILTDCNVEFTHRDSMPTLYGKVAQALTLETNAVDGHLKGSAAVATAMQGLASTVLGITQTRNAVGTGHGQPDISPAEPRHGRLAFNATVAVVEFVVQTWQAKL
ncbi:abortive infection family protein [Lysobacter korlensis]|uniref:Abortive infection family protein n=1 Tax=Lysobacter korlensis TaxID=553636 RepID=A0ABV6RVR8_9GAMM